MGNFSRTEHPRITTQEEKDEHLHVPCPCPQASTAQGPEGAAQPERVSFPGKTTAGERSLLKPFRTSFGSGFTASGDQRSWALHRQPGTRWESRAPRAGHAQTETAPRSPAQQGPHRLHRRRTQGASPAPSTACAICVLLTSTEASCLSVCQLPPLPPPQRGSTPQPRPGFCGCANANARHPPRTARLTPIIAARMPTAETSNGPSPVQLHTWVVQHRVSASEARLCNYKSAPRQPRPPQPRVGPVPSCPLLLAYFTGLTCRNSIRLCTCSPQVAALR